MNLSEVKVVNKEIPYSKIVDYVGFVAKNSFGSESGRFHQYKYDYALAVAVIAMYTDYDGEIYDYDEVMNLVYSNKWKKIIEELGNKYKIFEYYAHSEVEEMKKPFAFMNETVTLARDAIAQINGLVGAINKDKLNNYDFSTLIKAFEDVATKVADNEEKAENVVSMPINN